ncbi:MAG: radical SAM protein [Myxococcaceae bacterium]
MRLRHAAVKRSLGRIFLHHLRSAYFVELNEHALGLLSAALKDPELEGPGRDMLLRLEARGMVEPGGLDALPERNASALVSIELEPAGRCNLECRHCFASFSDALMTQETFAEIIRGAKALGAIELTFNGGEALLHPQLLEWISTASAAGLRCLLFTNATLVTDKVAKALAAAAVARVTVSLDGFEKAHDALRGAGAFRRAVRGISRLVSAGVQVFVTTVVHPGNQAEVDALHAHCRQELRVAGVRVSTIAAMGRAAGRPELQLGQERFVSIYAKERERPPGAASGFLPCLAGVNKLYVTATGAVHACHLFAGLGAPLGELCRSPLESIYAAVPGASYGKMLHTFSIDALRDCARCRSLAECQGGCRARAWIMSGEPHGPDPIACRKRGLEAPG